MSDEKEGIFSSLLSTTKSRLGNPLIGSFVISWLIMNWRFVGILLTGDEQMVHKIRMLEIEYMSPWRMLIVPTIAAFAWALGFPYLDNLIERVRRGPLRAKENSRIKEEIDSVKLRKKLSEETTALVLEERKAANFGFADYRQVELESAQTEIEFIEAKIKDLERLRDATMSIDQKEQVTREIQSTIRNLANARDAQRRLHTQVASERAELQGRSGT